MATVIRLDGEDLTKLSAFMLLAGNTSEKLEVKGRLTDRTFIASKGKKYTAESLPPPQR